jgi:CRISPR-associated protein Cmr2
MPRMLSMHTRAAKDVGEIGAASTGYIGMIYADGNNVGRLIATLQTPATYQQVSALLADAATNAVFDALAEYLEPARISSVKNQRQIEEYVHPFEILTIGGDDLLLIVPGNRAFDIALRVALLFEQDLANKLPAITGDAPAPPHDRAARYSGDDQHGFTRYVPVIGLSAGVVIAQESAPIFFLRGLVDELLKNAKQLAKDRKRATGDLGGAIDFMVMKSITMVTDKIVPFRAAALGDHSRQKVRAEPMRRLTARPYTWNEFAGLLAAIREFQAAKLPRSQLYRLRGVLQEAIEGGITASVMEYLYTRTRLRQGGDTMQTQIEHLWRAAAGAKPQRLTIGPWLPYTEYDQRKTSRLDHDDRETIWADLLEAYEMVQ